MWCTLVVCLVCWYAWTRLLDLRRLQHPPAQWCTATSGGVVTSSYDGGASPASLSCPDTSRSKCELLVSIESRCGSGGRTGGIRRLSELAGDTGDTWPPGDPGERGAVPAPIYARVMAVVSGESAVVSGESEGCVLNAPASEGVLTLRVCSCTECGEVGVPVPFVPRLWPQRHCAEVEAEKGIVISE